MPPEPDPAELPTTAFVAAPLRQPLAELDLQAYLSSPGVITTHSDGRWPVTGFTMTENRRLVAGHEADHDAGRAFTYTLLDPTRSRSLGCLYLNPLSDYLARTDASAATRAAFPEPALMVTFWVVEGLLDGEFPGEVVRAVTRWLSHAPGVGSAVFRVLPAETRSVAALDAVAGRDDGAGGPGLDRAKLDISGEHRPYLWYRLVPGG